MLLNNVVSEDKGIDNKMDNLNNEIDLFDLIDDVKSQFLWVVAAVIGFTALAIAYAFLVRPVYETEVVLREVRDADLIQINQPRLREALGVEKYIVEDGITKRVSSGDFITKDIAFKDARAALRSSSTVRHYFEYLQTQENSELLSLIMDKNLTSEQNFLKFYERFTFRDPGVKETDVYLRIGFQLADAKLAAQVLNEYVEFAIHKFERDKKAAVTMVIEGQISQWKFEAEQLRFRYFSEKRRRELEVQEAYDVAVSINQQQPIYSADRVAVGIEPPLYMMGSKALKAELQQLQSRSQKNEDNYIEGLPELLWKIAEAEKAIIQWDKVKYIEVDQQAIVPNAPIKPRKLLVVAIGMVLGGMVGVVTALIVAAARRRAEWLQQPAATN